MKIDIKTWITLLGMFLVFIFLKLVLFFNGGAYFDEGVYVGISKYFASFGSIGYFEPIRPLGLPLLLAPLQFITPNSLFLDRLLSTLLVFVSAILIYYVGRKHFDKNAGLWAAYLFLTSSLILIFGGFILTDIIAYTLTLFGASLMLERKYTLSGLFIGIGFLIRFPALIIVLPLILYLLFKERSKIINSGLRFAIGLLIAVLPYFAFNLLHYSGPIIKRLIQPLIDASLIVQNETWIYPKSGLLTFIVDIIKTNIISVILIFFCLVYYIRSHKEKIALFLLCIVSILLYFSYRVKIYDVRYTIFVIPYLVVLAGAGLSKFLEKKPVKLSYLAVIIILVPGLIVNSDYIKKPQIKTDPEIIDIIKNFNVGSIVTNSAFVLFYSKVKTNLMPGPNTANTYSTFLQDSNAVLFIFKPDEYYCPPNDRVCNEEFLNRVNHLVANNNLEYCGYLHGARIIIVTKGSGSISREQCLTNINYPVLEQPKSSVFVRINAVGVTKDGKLENSGNLKILLENLEKKNIATSVILVPANNPSLDSIKFINSFNQNIELGVFYTEKAETNDFIENLNSRSEKKVYVVSPKEDQWIKKEISIPNGIKYCMRGPWDSTIVPVPCKSVNIYTVKKWGDIEIYSFEELKESYDSIKNIDYSIVIDIPSEALAKSGNVETYKKFIGYI
ncbi:MAG: glycosyltransferase family 39 protein [Nanoarchaeota archaeon]